MKPPSNRTTRSQTYRLPVFKLLGPAAKPERQIQLEGQDAKVASDFLKSEGC
jgi:hypothetical protein